MVASILVAKYSWHVPLYRQAQMFATSGLCGSRLKPVYLRLLRVHFDFGQDRRRRDSRAGARSRPRPHQAGILLGGRFATTDLGARPTLRPSPSATLPGAPSGAVHGLKLLEGYRGIVQCDGYAAYRTIRWHTQAKNAYLLLYGCTHLRRRCSTSPRAAMRGSRAKRSNGSLRLCDREDDPGTERR